MSTSSGRYLPPHLRHRPQPGPTPEAGPSSSSAPRAHSSAPSPRTTTQSRTPWAAASSSSTPSDSMSVEQQQSLETSGYRRSSSINQDGGRQASSSYRFPPRGDSHSAPTRSARSGVAPTLHVFGDSFTGPLKLLSEDCARVTSFKGASAKVSERVHESLDTGPAMSPSRCQRANGGEGIE